MYSAGNRKVISSFLHVSSCPSNKLKQLDYSGKFAQYLTVLNNNAHQWFIRK